MPAGTARNQRVVTFVTDSELDSLLKLSEEQNASLSTTIYQLLSERLAGKAGRRDDTEA